MKETSGNRTKISGFLPYMLAASKRQQKGTSLGTAPLRVGAFLDLGRRNLLSPDNSGRLTSIWAHLHVPFPKCRKHKRRVPGV